jgi:hypothetical protein
VKVTKKYLAAHANLYSINKIDVSKIIEQQNKKDKPKDIQIKLNL